MVQQSGYSAWFCPGLFVIFTGRKKNGNYFCAACHTGRDVSVGRGSDDPLSLSCDHTCPDVYCPLHFNEKTSVDSDFRADCLSLLSASQVGGTFYNGCVCEQ